MRHSGRALSVLPSYPNSAADRTMESFYKTGIPISSSLALMPFATPGHTRHCHSLSLITADDQLYFSGDCLLLTAVGRTDLDSSHSIQDVQNNKRMLFHSLQEYEKRRIKSPDHVWIAPAHDYSELTMHSWEWVLQNNPFVQIVMSADETVAISWQRFLSFFEEREKKLAKFDSKDIQLCVRQNKMCGAIDGIPTNVLERLWNKRAGACG